MTRLTEPQEATSPAASELSLRLHSLLSKAGAHGEASLLVPEAGDSTAQVPGAPPNSPARPGLNHSDVPPPPPPSAAGRPMRRFNSNTDLRMKRAPSSPRGRKRVTNSAPATPARVGHAAAPLPAEEKDTAVARQGHTDEREEKAAERAQPMETDMLEAAVVTESRRGEEDKTLNTNKGAGDACRDPEPATGRGTDTTDTDGRPDDLALADTGVAVEFTMEVTPATPTAVAPEPATSPARTVAPLNPLAASTPQLNVTVSALEVSLHDRSTHVALTEPTLVSTAEMPALGHDVPEALGGSPAVEEHLETSFVDVGSPLAPHDKSMHMAVVSTPHDRPITTREMQDAIREARAVLGELSLSMQAQDLAASLSPGSSPAGRSRSHGSLLGTPTKSGSAMIRTGSFGCKTSTAKQASPKQPSRLQPRKQGPAVAPKKSKMTVASAAAKKSATKSSAPTTNVAQQPPKSTGKQQGRQAAVLSASESSALLRALFGRRSAEVVVLRGCLRSQATPGVPVAIHTADPSR